MDLDWVRDSQDYRQSLYTNTKPDHPADDLTGELCDCEAGDTRWEKNGIAMRVEWPFSAQRAPELQAEPDAGR